MKYSMENVKQAVMNAHTQIGGKVFTQVQLAEAVARELIHLVKPEPRRPGECLLEVEAVSGHVIASFLSVLGLKDSDVSLYSRIDGLCADSLDAVEIVLEIEERTGRPVPDEVTERLWAATDATIESYSQGLIDHWC